MIQIDGDNEGFPLRVMYAVPRRAQNNLNADRVSCPTTA